MTVLVFCLPFGIGSRHASARGTERPASARVVVGCSVLLGSAVNAGRPLEGRRPAWQPSPTWGPCDTPWLSVERRLSASASPLALHQPPATTSSPVQYSTVTTTPRNTPTCFCSSLIDCYCFQILDGPKKLLQKVNNGFSFFFNLGSRLVTHMIGYG